MSRYVVGIDLGTTNSALAYAERPRRPSDQPGTDPSLPIPQVVAVERRGRAAALAVVPLPAGSQGVPRRGARPALEVAAGPRRGRLRARARRQGPGPAGQLGQELAVAPRRRPPRADPALDRRRRCGQGLAGRGLGRLSRAPARRLEPADRRQDGRRSAGEPGRAPDRPGLVRRRRPRADHRGRRQGRAQARDAARRAAGRLLRLARRPGREMAQAGQGRRHHPGLRRRRRHDRLHPDRRHRRRRRPGPVAPGRRRAHPAGRRQHGPGPGPRRRRHAAPGHGRARRRPARRARPCLPHRQGDPLRRPARRTPRR